MSYDLSLEDLSQYFHLPINDVAKKLGVCATVLKKICRKNGIQRWPHRKIKSLNNMIADLERIVPANESDRISLENEIQSLKDKREFLFRNPNVSYKSVVPKYCVSSCQVRVSKAVNAGELREPEAPTPPTVKLGKRKRPTIDPGEEENAVNVLLNLLVQDDTKKSTHTETGFNGSIRTPSPVLPAAMDVEQQRGARFRGDLTESTEAASLIQQLPAILDKKPVDTEMELPNPKRRKLFDQRSAPFRSLPPIHPFSVMQPMHPFTSSAVNMNDFRLVPTMDTSGPQ